MRRLAALLVMVFAASTHGTTLPKIAVEELYANADAVVLVQIISGRTLGIGQDSCGAIYTGHIERQFKGTPLSEIEFGHYFGYEVGGRYLLFLTKPGKEYRPLASTNSVSMAAEAEFYKRCDSQLTANRIMHSGNGALKIAWARVLEFEEGVLVPSRYVRFPDSMETFPADEGERFEFSDVVWIREQAVIDYLATLK